MPNAHALEQDERGIVRGVRVCLAAVCTAACLSVSWPALAVQPGGGVKVQFADSTQFTEARKNGRMSGEEHVAWLDELSRHLAERAAQGLAPNETLAITITDIDRAGETEPWRGPQAHDLRVVRDVYPPSIDLDFRLTGADGTILREGSARLRDVAFMSRINRYNDDSLRYEKTLIDDWVDKEFPRRAN